MSTDTSSELAALRAQMRADGEFAQDHGEPWVKRLEAEFARLPNGTIVVIDCRTGEYVIGPTVLKAADEFERRFGKEIGYVHRIGGGFFVGGGIG